MLDQFHVLQHAALFRLLQVKWPLIDLDKALDKARIHALRIAVHLAGAVRNTQNTARSKTSRQLQGAGGTRVLRPPKPPQIRTPVYCVVFTQKISC